MTIDNKIAQAWNGFFSLKSPRFLIQPFFECFRAGFEAGIQTEWSIERLSDKKILELKLAEALRQRDFYASLVGVDDKHKTHFENELKKIGEVK